MMKKSLIWTLTLSMLMCISPGLCLGQKWQPDSTTIEKLESSVMSSDFAKWGAQPPLLCKYARYYVAKRKHGHHVLYGELVEHEILHDKAAGIYFVASEEDFPVVFGGGCGMIHVVYDVDSAHVLSLFCNGPI